MKPGMPFIHCSDGDEMKNVYAVDSANSIKQAQLSNLINNIEDFDLTKFIPENFLGKVIFNVEEVDFLSQSIVSIKDNYKIQSENKICTDLIFKIKTNDASINDYYDESLKLAVNEERYVYVITSVDIPFIARKGMPESKQRYARMSEVLNVFIVLVKNKGREISPCPTRQVFDSYGALGFAIIDMDKFDEFISMNTPSNDLIEAFTTSEIASELFNQGLIILSWGHTPWVYYLNSESQDKILSLLGERTIYSGIYKFQNTSNQYSVIPGNELQSWCECKKKAWPLISLEGEGEFVSLTLYVKEAVSQSDSNYPIPTFHLERFLYNDEPVMNPLLESDLFNENN